MSFELPQNDFFRRSFYTIVRKTAGQSDATILKKMTVGEFVHYLASNSLEN
jgi:hypothetical protein